MMCNSFYAHSKRDDGIDGHVNNSGRCMQEQILFSKASSSMHRNGFSSCLDYHCTTPVDLIFISTEPGSIAARLPSAACEMPRSILFSNAQVICY